MITKLHKLVCFFSFYFYHAKYTAPLMKGVIFMNKLIKMCIVGGIVYVISDVSYQLGKGRILGALAKTNMSASQCIDAISDDKNLRVKLIKMIAKMTEEGP